jgi:hypothetical protein
VTDESEIGEAVNELTIFFRAADLEHALNRWLRSEVPIAEVLPRLGALRQEVELLALMNERACLELAVRLSRAPTP